MSYAEQEAEGPRLVAEIKKLTEERDHWRDRAEAAESLLKRCRCIVDKALADDDRVTNKG